VVAPRTSTRPRRSSIGEDKPDEEQLFRDLWEDESQRYVVIESLKADCELRTGSPEGWSLRDRLTDIRGLSVRSGVDRRIQSVKPNF
jgi:hypothetical protein